MKTDLITINNQGMGFPAALRECRKAAEYRKLDKKPALQLELLDLMNQLMIETNPIPAKAACAALGYGENRLRLPLVPMEDKNREKLFGLMREAGLEVQA